MRKIVASPNGMQWTVKCLVIPLGMRPIDRISVLDAATPRRTFVDGMPNRLPDAFSAWTGPLPLAVLFLPLTLPLLPVVLLLRRLRLLPWTVEARTYPWGRRYPPIVFSYAVRGKEEALQVVDQLVEALARGDGAPVIPGAENIREPRTVHGGSDQRPSSIETAGKLYGGR